MNVRRMARKKNAVRQHRKDWYLRTLDKVFTGQAKPADVALRWNKLKEVL